VNGIKEPYHSELEDFLTRGSNLQVVATPLISIVFYKVNTMLSKLKEGASKGTPIKKNRSTSSAGRLIHHKNALLEIFKNFLAL
jgi:hypothetical protein